MRGTEVTDALNLAVSATPVIKRVFLPCVLAAYLLVSRRSIEHIYASARWRAQSMTFWNPSRLSPFHLCRAIALSHPSTRA
ncbi:uncharacterized protein PHALS_14579 [Plasmopara halstedii]|uniref:Uncharacterized protein n=1 Tax=Plasmopara halstedii TaxID=4781 RepID=A0A0P1AKI5_PLAHL|nr:uncharacterized protein PHALS_14579 [Plasmopara halstedii]CEG41912.1 hypothetical protein PHALS_14579 [Plasmopara halstedii]|eukprot:XP_024578281.1 hypothetical protein PHALS_14579 [Plasmopara halstedii]